MPTSYPGQTDSFTARTDGVDIIMAAHVNNLQDAVAAIETELGVDPKGSAASVGAALAARLDRAGGNLTGDVTANSGVKVDGVDISAHTHSGATGDAPNIPVGSVTNLQSSLDGKVSKTGDTMGGDLAMGIHRITGMGSPSDSSDAVTKGYVDGHPNMPSSDQKSALAGTYGTPGSSNHYLTETDPSVSRLTVRFRDDFIGNKDARWTLSGTGASYTQNAELGGTGTLATGATTGNSAALSLNGNGVTDKTKNPTVTTSAKLNTTSQVSATLAGLQFDTDNRIEIFYDPASGTNFMYRCKNVGAQTVVDSGLAADTSHHLFTLKVDNGAGSVSFSIDGAHLQTITTNIPTNLLEPRVAVVANEDADKQLTLDFFYLEAER